MGHKWVPELTSRRQLIGCSLWHMGSHQWVPKSTPNETLPWGPVGECPSVGSRVNSPSALPQGLHAQLLDSNLDPAEVERAKEGQVKCGREGKQDQTTFCGVWSGGR